MSDNLLKRLKSDYSGGYCNKRNIKAAITAIEALQAENKRLREAVEMVAKAYTAEDYTERSFEYKLGEKCRIALSAPDPTQRRPGNE